MNRKTMTVGLATLGLLGVTSGGVAWVGTASAAPPNTGAEAGQCGAAWGPGDGRGGGQGGGQHGMAAGESAPMTAAADYLDLSQTELVDELRAGSSLADVAKDQGKSVAGLKDAMLSAMQSNLDSRTDLTDAQREAALAAMETRVDDMIDGTYPYGRGSGHQGGMMGGGQGWMGGLQA